MELPLHTLHPPVVTIFSENIIVYGESCGILFVSLSITIETNKMGLGWVIPDHLHLHLEPTTVWCLSFLACSSLTYFFASFSLLHRVALPDWKKVSWRMSRLCLVQTDYVKWPKGKSFYHDTIVGKSVHGWKHSRCCCRGILHDNRLCSGGRDIINFSFLFIFSFVKTWAKLEKIKK